MNLSTNTNAPDSDTFIFTFLKNGSRIGTTESLPISASSLVRVDIMNGLTESDIARYKGKGALSSVAPAAVPEAGTVFSLGALLCAGGGFLFVRRKRA